MGLRLGRAPPPALQPVARRRPLARRHLDPARRDVAGVGPRRGRGPQDPRSSSSSAACSASRSGSTRSSRRCCSRSRREGIEVVDGQQLMQEARMIKTQDEITLLNTACMMVDAAYEELYRAMRPGMRENECVGLVNKVLYDLGSEFVEGVNAISGERCNPHPHVYTDRVLRPGDPAYFDILHSFMGYRTCYYRTFAIGERLAGAGRRLQALPLLPRRRDRADPAGRHDRATSSRCGRRRRSSASPTRRPRSRSSSATASGSSIWEKPIFSRLVSLDHPGADPGGHGVRARDVLAGERRLVGGAHRGAARRHRRRLRGDHALPGRGPRDRRQAATTRSAGRCRSSATTSRTATRAWTPTPARPCRATADMPAGDPVRL